MYKNIMLELQFRPIRSKLIVLYFSYSDLLKTLLSIGIAQKHHLVLTLKSLCMIRLKGNDEVLINKFKLFKKACDL